jgi:hypothetical protein
MKTTRFFSLVVLCSAAMASPTRAALMGLTKNVSSPYYADFTANGLSVSSTYNASSQTATFHAANSISQVESYTSHPLSPGTLGAYNNAGFNGFYSIDATIQKIGSVWNLTGGTVTVKGNLMGGTTSDMLLQGSLKTGVSGVGGAFGFQDFGLTPDASHPFYDIFEFRFTPTSGNAAILADFFGANNGQAAIILDANFNYANPALFFNGDWAHPFSSGTANGVADSFVPEPSAYPLTAASAALLGLLFVRRKSCERISAVNV